ncbi:MAG: hypothetical protein WCZ72_11000 [Gemmobacter sp.]
MIGRAALGLGVLLMAGCGPVTVQEAERQCFDRARLAERPRGEVALGLGTGGRTVGYADVDISSDFVLGRDPEKVWQSCVYRLSGEPPGRPYSALPDTRGPVTPRRRG